jgi:hypothetical protein
MAIIKYAELLNLSENLETMILDEEATTTNGNISDNEKDLL